MRAVDLFEEGVIPAEIARQVGYRIRSCPTGARCGGSLAETRCAPPAERDGDRS
jgi:hypothetical protein